MAVIALNRSRIAGLDAVLKTGVEYSLAGALLPQPVAPALLRAQDTGAGAPCRPLATGDGG